MVADSDTLLRNVERKDYDYAVDSACHLRHRSRPPRLAGPGAAPHTGPRRARTELATEGLRRDRAVPAPAVPRSAGPGGDRPALLDASSRSAPMRRTDWSPSSGLGRKLTVCADAPY